MNTPQIELVYDGDSLNVPTSMGQPKAGQLEGSTMEQLAELCGRICYDSLGQGRSSSAYHEHIIEVGHLSVYEHCNMRLDVSLVKNSRVADHSLRSVLMNRPGVYYYGAVVSINFRAILEWHRWTAEFRDKGYYDDDLMYAANAVGNNLLIHLYKDNNLIPRQRCGHHTHGNHTTIYDSLVYESPISSINEDNHWVSLYLAGSRGFSHEQVRHGDFSAISQRSTRYCDESKSFYHYHPLFSHPAVKDKLDMNEIRLHEQMDKKLYDKIVDALMNALDGVVDKRTARKQARGAARGMLGNFLGTEMIFSATAAQWRTMMLQRANPAADAEIRVIYNKVYELFCKNPNLVKYTEDLRRVDVADGLGFGLVKQEEVS